MEIKGYSTIQSSGLTQEMIKRSPKETPHSAGNTDQISISPKSAEFMKAVDLVRKEIDHSRRIGYPDPPRALSNGKQRELIKERIFRELKTPYREDLLDQAAGDLWSESGYRNDTAPLPNPFNDGYSIDAFLTQDDRAKLDLAYDEDIANGLSHKEAYTNTGKRMRPVAFERYKEHTIELGASWGGGSITGYTPEEWDEFKANLPPEYKDVHGMPGAETTLTKTEELQLSQKNYVFQQLLSGMEDSSNIKEEYDLLFKRYY